MAALAEVAPQIEGSAAPPAVFGLFFQRPATDCCAVLNGLLPSDARERGSITQPRLFVNS